MDNNRKLAMAKMQLLTKKDLAFFSTLLLQAKVVEDKEVAAFSTDGLEIKYNPDVVKKMEVEDLIVSLTNCTLHNALMHSKRMKKSYRPDLYNKASNIVTNILLSDYKMIKEPVYYSDFRGDTVEKVYEKLVQMEQNNKKPPEPENKVTNSPPVIQPNKEDGDKKGNGNSEQGEGQQQTSYSSQGDYEQAVEDSLQQARTSTRMNNPNYSPTGAPEFMDETFESFAKPKVPWKTLFRRFLNSSSKNNYSWQKPNRRFFPKHYLPSLHSEGLDRVDFIIDTSGSIDEHDFKQFLGEIDKVLTQFKPDEIGLSQFDHRYRGTEIINKFTDLKKTSIKGGGGTNIKSTLKEVDKFKTKCIVIFTDGYMDLNIEEPKHPVLWIVYDNPRFKAPFGKAIIYEIDR